MKPTYEKEDARLFLCDNLKLLETLPSESIDLIYSDVLYNTGRKFKDYTDKLGTPDEAVDWYRPRLIHMKRVLKNTGSIYIHCDWRLSHYLKVEMDKIFGIKNFRGNLVWCYRSAGFSKNKWSQKHDDILFYTKSDKWTFNLEEVREEEMSKSTKDRWEHKINEDGNIIINKNGKEYITSPYSPPRDWFIIKTLSSSHSERVGYDTQKPKELINRLIKASSAKGDIVADFFMGSGTTAIAALELDRKFIGCDINKKALEISIRRVEDFETNRRIKVN